MNHDQSRRLVAAKNNDWGDCAVAASPIALSRKMRRSHAKWPIVERRYFDNETRVAVPTPTFSAHFCKEHFDSKGHRYRAALEIAPRARLFEVLPFLLFLNDRLPKEPMSLTMADVLCGSGFLSSRLASLFGRSYGVDISSGMLSAYPAGAKGNAIRAELNQATGLNEIQVTADVICSLVGLHHVYMRSNGCVDQSASVEAQVTILSKWAEALPEKGLMLIADVTDPDVDAGYCQNAASLRQAFTEVENTFKETWAEVHSVLSSSGADRYPHDLADYSRHLPQVAVEGRLPRPGSWFREVVDKRGQYGHEDCFPTPTSIVAELRRYGFSVDFYELPTPWVFDSEEQFLLFFHEIFGFGPPAETASDIAPSVRDFILASANQYLGIVRQDSGAVLVGWRLGYYVVSGKRT